MNSDYPYSCPACYRTLRRRGRRVLLLMAAAFLAGMAVSPYMGVSR